MTIDASLLRSFIPTPRWLMILRILPIRRQFCRERNVATSWGSSTGWIRRMGLFRKTQDHVPRKEVATKTAVSRENLTAVRSGTSLGKSGNPYTKGQTLSGPNASHASAQRDTRISSTTHWLRLETWFYTHTHTHTHARQCLEVVDAQRRVSSRSLFCNGGGLAISG